MQSIFTTILLPYHYCVDIIPQSIKRNVDCCVVQCLKVLENSVLLFVCSIATCKSIRHTGAMAFKNVSWTTWIQIATDWNWKGFLKVVRNSINFRQSRLYLQQQSCMPSYVSCDVTYHNCCDVNKWIYGKCVLCSVQLMQAAVQTHHYVFTTFGFKTWKYHVTTTIVVAVHNLFLSLLSQWILLSSNVGVIGLVFVIQRVNLKIPRDYVMCYETL